MILDTTAASNNKRFSLTRFSVELWYSPGFSNKTITHCKTVFELPGAIIPNAAEVTSRPVEAEPCRKQQQKKSLNVKCRSH